MVVAAREGLGADPERNDVYASITSQVTLETWKRSLLEKCGLRKLHLQNKEQTLLSSRGLAVLGEGCQGVLVPQGLGRFLFWDQETPSGSMAQRAAR